MKIIGINTATNELSIALVDNETVLAEKKVAGPTAKAEHIVLWLDEVLKAAGVVLSALEGVGVAIGPGAFTGLRIGVTTAKTLAQMLKVPIVGVSTLEAYAAQAEETSVRVVLKACRGETNTALFTRTNKVLSRMEADHPEKDDALWAIIRQEKSILLGDVPAEFAARTHLIKPDAVSVARIAQTMIKQGNIADPRILVPIYSHGANIKLSPRIHGELLKQQARS